MYNSRTSHDIIPPPEHSSRDYEVPLVRLVAEQFPAPRRVGVVREAGAPRHHHVLPAVVYGAVLCYLKLFILIFILLYKN